MGGVWVCAVRGAHLLYGEQLLCEAVVRCSLPLSLRPLLLQALLRRLAVAPARLVQANGGRLGVHPTLTHRTPVTRIRPPILRHRTRSATGTGTDTDTDTDACTRTRTRSRACNSHRLSLGAAAAMGYRERERERKPGGGSSDLCHCQRHSRAAHHPGRMTRRVQ